MIVVFPWVTVVASPPEAMLATPGADELQTTEPVIFCVVPLLKFPVAKNCCVSPLGIVGALGATLIDIIWTGTPVPDSLILYGEPF